MTAAAVASPAPLPMPLHHPNQVNIESRMEKVVLNMRVEARPANVAIATDPEKEEHMQFCDCIFPHDNFRYKLENGKVCRFVFCCVKHLEIRKRAVTRAEVIVF